MKLLITCLLSFVFYVDSVVEASGVLNQDNILPYFHDDLSSGRLSWIQFLDIFKKTTKSR
jgi:hypothetical protein